MSTARRVAVAAFVVIVLGVFGVMCQRVSERGRYAVPYSTYGAGPEGTRALFLWTEAAGARPMRWSRDMSGLPADGTLIALGGCDGQMARPVSRYERETLESWVEAGGVLVVAGAHEYLWPEMGVHLWRPAGDCTGDLGIVGALARAEQEAQRGDGDASLPPPPDAGVPAEDPALTAFREDPLGTVEELADPEELPPARWALPTAPPLAGLGAVPLRKPASIVVAEGSDASTFLRLPTGSAGVVVRKGRGAVVALASASPLQNREISNADGAVLFARLLDEVGGEGPVIFDEYHLGVGEKRSLTQYLRDVGGGAAALQVLIVIGFFLWRAGTRFGGFRTEPPPIPAGTASYVSAVGTLYDKSGDAAGAVALLARHALQRVAEHHHLPSADPEVLARELEERHRLEAAASVRRLGAAAGSPATDRRQLVSRARELDELVARAVSEKEAGS